MLAAALPSLRPRYEAGATGRRLPQMAELASNESPLGPSPAALAAALRTLSASHRYPDPGAGLLRDQLAADNGLSPEQVIVTAGTTSLIDLIARAFVGPGSSAVVSERSFLAYDSSVLASGGALIRAPMRGDTIDLGAVLAAIRQDTRVVFLANPNNPTGTAFGRLDFAGFLAGLREDVLVVLDEAYREYALGLGFDLPDGVTALRRDRRVLVLHTFSKVYGLAGLRVGYGLGDPAVIEALRDLSAPFSVSSAAEAAAIAALEDNAHVEGVVSANAEGLRALNAGLRALGFEPAPSVSNFVYVDTGLPANELRDALLAADVRVRSLAAWGAPTAIRVTVGKPSEIARFLAALRAVLEELGR